MGGCASRPRDSDPEVKPADNPIPIEADPPTQENAVDAAAVEPLVDISEAKADEPSSEKEEPKTTVADLVAEISSATTEAPQIASAREATVAPREVRPETVKAEDRKEEKATTPEIVEVKPKELEKKENAAAPVVSA